VHFSFFRIRFVYWVSVWFQYPTDLRWKVEETPNLTQGFQDLFIESIRRFNKKNHIWFKEEIGKYIVSPNFSLNGHYNKLVIINIKFRGIKIEVFRS
jgi:hypothetical protein